MRSGLASVASLRWDWAFKAPVLIGDRISAVVGIAGSRTTKRADRGIVSLALEARKQDGTLVQTGTNQLLIRRVV